MKFMKGTFIQILICEILGILYVLSLTLLKGSAANYDFLIWLVCFIGGIVAPIFGCYWKNREIWGNQKKQMFSKRFLRMLSRIMIVIVFLALEAILESLSAGNWLSGKFQSDIGIMLAYASCNFNLAMMISLFPLIYAVTELCWN